MTAPYNKINYSLSYFFASSAGASVVSVVASATSSTVSVASAGVSTTSSFTSSAGASSVKSSFTTISLSSILAPTNSLVLAAFPTLSLK